MQLLVGTSRYVSVPIAAIAVSLLVLRGSFGLFIVIACAATLHAHGLHVDDARDAARALEPLAGNAATTLSGLGLIGAALLAAAVVPLSTAYSVAEAFEQRADLNDTIRDAHSSTAPTPARP